MAWMPDYCTLEELKAHLRVTDTADDLALGGVITAASRAIEHETNRQFGKETEAVSRYYTAVCGYYLEGRPAIAIDDLPTTNDLLVAYDDNDDDTFGTPSTIGEDLTLWPYNASQDGKPWTHLLSRGGSSLTFPTYPNSIRVTGLFGWASVPSVVKTACLIQASRFFVRRDSAFGVAGSPEFGSELRLLDRLDPDVALLLTSVKRHWGAV